MISTENIRKIKALVTEGAAHEALPLSRYTTFRIGGPAELLVEPDEAELIEVVRFCHKNQIPYTILGNGSNVLVSDDGLEGVTIVIGSRMADITVDSNRIIAGAGALLSQIAVAAKKAALDGFVFASGIPGTIGGAVLMNAGAYGGEIKDVLVDVTVYDPAADEVLTVPAGELDLSYRHSVVAEKGWLILKSTIALRPGKAAEIEASMAELTAKRKEKQPLNYPSAGSTFKRPEGHFAAALIDEAGLRGFAVGDAQVSEKHCGFVINKGNASAADVMELMKQVERRVYEYSGIHLEPEVRLLGFK